VVFFRSCQEAIILSLKGGAVDENALSSMCFQKL
jgi:hypothetical protein